MYTRHTKIPLIFIDAAATWTHAIQMTRFTLMQMSARCCKFQSLDYQEKSCWRAQKLEINNCICLQYKCGGVIPRKLLLNFYFCFVVIFVAFSPSWCFFTDCSFCLYQAFWYKSFHPKSHKKVRILQLKVQSMHFLKL